jgi:hypothetical protein
MKFAQCKRQRPSMSAKNFDSQPSTATAKGITIDGNKTLTVGEKQGI